MTTTATDQTYAPVTGGPMKANAVVVQKARAAIQSKDGKVFLTGQRGEVLRVLEIGKRLTRSGTFRVNVGGLGWTEPNDYWTLEVW
jgi:hypothetical protein